MRRFQDIWVHLVPGWLQNGAGALIQQAQGALLDMFAERMRQTALLSFPSRCPSDALPEIGHDRGIVRGLFEPELSYRARLIAWRYPRGHRVRGSAPALLDQVSNALRGTVYLTIDARGTQYELGVDTATRGVTWNWDGTEGASIGTQWGRYWVVVKSTGSYWPSFDDGAWGDTIDADPDVSLAGQGIHSGEVSAVRALASNSSFGWTPAGRRAVCLVIWFEGDAMPEPDGTWDDWAGRPLDQYAFEPLNAAYE